MNSKEQLAEDFAKKYRNTSNIYHNNYEIYLAGYNTCEKLLKKYIEFIELEEDSTFLSRNNEKLTKEEIQYLKDLYERQ